MTTDITTLDDLSFTARDADDAPLPWHPERVTHSPSAGLAYGLACVQHELARLALVDEHDAYSAITQALTSRTWNDQCAEELGFADGLARLAIVGLRAMAAEDHLPFSTQFDPTRAHHDSLRTRVAVLEAQLHAMQVKPWRTLGQAGLE